MSTTTRMEEAARLFYIEGLTRQEVAAYMGISDEGVKSHLRWFRTNHGLTSRREALAWFRTHEGANA